MLKDTIKTLTEAIEVGTKVLVVNNDITENEPRPCFYIEPISISTDFDGIRVEHEVEKFQITYFGKNSYEGYLDLLTMKDILQACLLGTDLTRADGSQMDIVEIAWNIYRGDMVLTAEVEVELFGQDHSDNEDEEYYMKTLKYDEK